MSEPCGARQPSVFQWPPEPSQGRGDLGTGHSAMAWRCALLNSGPEYVRATVSGDRAFRRARSWDSKMEIPESRQLAVSEAHRSTTVDNHTPA